MIFRDKKSKHLTGFIAEVLSLFTAGLLLLGPVSGVLGNAPAITVVGSLALMLALGQFLVYLIYWCFYHKVYLGIQYAVTHARILRDIKMALLDAGAGYIIEQYSGEEKTARLPKVILDLDPDMRRGIVKIHNHIRYDNKLENVNISSALGKYIVEQQYSSDDMNWYIFEFEDSSIDRQLCFNNHPAFRDFARQYDSYTLAMDVRNQVPLSSMLLVGQTGSGKTYALYSLIYQLLIKPIKQVLYFCDPKNSSLCVLGSRIAPDRTAGSIEDIIKQLEDFYAQMLLRKEELKEKLNEKLDADYRHWKLPAHIFILDEFSSFQAIVATMDKKERDKIAALLRNIVLQGRQLGFFLWIVMQKSDASDIPTAIRDNLPWKVVLGCATNTTYITAFEHAADLPKRKFGPGQGLYTCQGLTRQPKVTSFPTLDFDILCAVEEAVSYRV